MIDLGSDFRAMGLDVSVTGTGIAVIGGGIAGIGTVGYVAERCGYSLPNDASFVSKHERIASILSRVRHYAQEFRPNVVAIEDVVFTSENSSKAQIWGMNFVAQHALYRLGFEVEMIALDTWRAWLGVSWQAMKREFPKASGYQRSKLLKDAVRAAVKRRFGIEFDASKHNECEAFALAQFAKYRRENPTPRTENLFPGFKGGKVARKTKKRKVVAPAIDDGTRRLI